MRIADRNDLRDALKDAAELEHQLMLQYLYTGFSLKRGPDATCSPAQYEMVRRWSSTLFMIARQEMEHLSLANGMLAAIGAPVHFARPNIVKQGLLSPYLASETLAGALGAEAPAPISLPYAYDRFDVDTVGRFVCGESPPWDEFRDGAEPPPWCFTRGPQDAGAQPPPLRLDPWLPAEEPGVAAGTVQKLYEAIRQAFVELPDLFVKAPPEVVIPVEYNVFVFPVTDQRSALGAIDVILEQGEGLHDPWNPDTHFRRFREIRQELCDEQERHKNFDPAYLLLRNPQRSEIKNAFTCQVFDVANQAYATLLLILAGLYQRAVPPAAEAYPFFSSALRENAFAPAMTMIIRALNEVLVLLPIHAGVDHGWRTASNFFIGPDDLDLLCDPKRKWLGDIDFLHGRWEEMTVAIGAAAQTATSAAPAVARDLRYVYESARRAGTNLRNTNEFGLYSKYIKI